MQIGDKKVILAIIHDITKRKRTEDKLRESEEKLARSKKMESLGLLAGGVAHDLNNVLSGIVSYPELLLLDLPKDSKYTHPNIGNISLKTQLLKVKVSSRATNSEKCRRNSDQEFLSVVPVEH